MQPSPRLANLVAAAIRALLLLAFLLVPLQAEAASQQSFAYTPPKRQPKGERTRYVRENPDAVFQQVWAFLEEQQLELESVNPQERTLVARYRGDPRPYLDCGVVTLLIDGKPAEPPRRYSANKPEVRTAKNPKGRRIGLLRRMRLDARLVIQVEPHSNGKGARIRSEAAYVATKTINRLRKGGKAEELIERDVISFTSDETGRFKKGTACVGTGRLETLPLEPFKKIS